VQTPEMLNLLTLLTFVDAQATSDQLWNGFKDSLLRVLHARTLALLTGGAEFVRADEKQRERLLQEAQRRLPEAISADELHAHFATLPPRYFHIHTASEIVGDLQLAHRFMRLQLAEAERALEPVTAWQDAPDRGYSAVKVCTWDRAGLFSHIAGSLSAVGLNILSAQIFTRSDGIAMDTFYVADARTGVLASPEQQEHLGALLAQVLVGGQVDFRALIARQKVTQPLYQAYTGERIPTVIYLDNEASETRTLIEVETEDRIGLLYTISQTLTELQLDISAAKICTEKGAAIDSFYVSELSGVKVLEPERQRHIERKLNEAIATLDQA
jgi:[protein-PII] uridylyltransferase